IETQGAASAYVFQQLPDFLPRRRALAKPDLAAGCREIGKILGEMLAMARRREQKSGETDRIDHDVRASLLCKVFIVGIADCSGDPEVRRQLPRGKDRQD